MKIKRQQLILEIIAKNPMATQEQIVQELDERGFKVTQATVSRDIKELGLIKYPFGENHHRYVLPPNQAAVNAYSRLQRLVKDSVLKVDDSENLILVRTLPGTAHAVASCLDSLPWPEILGTVAGDDTILIVVKPREMVPVVIERLQKLRDN